MEIKTFEEFLTFNEMLEIIEGRLTDILRYKTNYCNIFPDNWEYIADNKTICIYYTEVYGGDWERECVSIPVEYILMTKEQWKKDMQEKEEERERIRLQEQKRIDEEARKRKEYEERQEYERLKKKYGDNK